jgi:ubiquinone biosynthesis protein
MIDLLTVVAIPVTVLILVVLFAVTARRLLGIRIGLIRTVLAGVIGYGTASIVATAISRLHPAAFFTVALGAALLVAMAFLLAAEFLLPTRGVSRPFDLFRATRRWLARARRYGQITRIAVRHGLGPGRWGRRKTPHRRSTLARSLRKALAEGGVTFVKLGQMLCTRADLLPPLFIAELTSLRDRVPAAPWAQVREVLRLELGVPIEERFSRFDPLPLAAASVAQVHGARLRDGREVVVKVQRPGVRPLVEADLDIILRLAQTLNARTVWGPTIGVLDLASGFAIALREELDFRVEAANIDVVTTAQSTGPSGDPVQLPHRHPQLCTERMLVLDRLDGVPLPAIGDTARRLDRPALARTLLHSVLRQILHHGVFHADPHSGNVFLLSDGRLALLDFGSVGRIDSIMRGALLELLLAIDRGDPAALCDSMLAIVTRPEATDVQQLQRALGQFLVRHLGPGAGADLAMFGELLRLTTRHGLTVPPEAAAVFRSLATLQGTLASFAPEFDVVAEARRFATDDLLGVEQLSGAARADTADVAALLPVLRRMPRRVDRITSSMEQGRFGVNVNAFADERSRRFITKLVHEVLLTAVGASTAVLAALLLGINSGPVIAPQLRLPQLLGYNFLLVSCIIGLRVLLIVARR